MLAFVADVGVGIVNREVVVTILDERENLISRVKIANHEMEKS